jgi:hypothetical protein
MFDFSEHEGALCFRRNRLQAVMRSSASLGSRST